MNTLLDLIGLRPVVVPQLGQQSIILIQSRIILIDSDADMDDVIDHALATAMDLEAKKAAG